MPSQNQAVVTAVANVLVQFGALLPDCTDVVISGINTFADWASAGFAVRVPDGKPVDPVIATMQLFPVFRAPSQVLAKLLCAASLLEKALLAVL